MTEAVPVLGSSCFCVAGWGAAAGPAGQVLGRIPRVTGGRAGCPGGFVLQVSASRSVVLFAALK